MYAERSPRMFRKATRSSQGLARDLSDIGAPIVSLLCSGIQLRITAEARGEVEAMGVQLLTL
jgi:hypothetical protein